MREYDADVVVVGSGCTGGWACKVLTARGHDVLLLEAGRAATAADCPQAWYEAGVRQPPQRTGRQDIQQNHPAFCENNRALWIDDVDHPYVTDPAQPFVWIRARIAGGRSNLWGGQCWRLTPHELEAPAHDGVGPPWPLSYAELAPYYAEVERYHGVSGRADGDADLPDQEVSGEVQLTAAEERLLEALRRTRARGAIPARTAAATVTASNGSGRWPRFSSLGSTLPAALATGRLRIAHDTVVARLELDARGRQVSAAVCLDAHTGAERRVRARAYILCASTIESTRILLNSADARHPAGLGNSSGVLGRYLMDHVGTVVVGRVAADAAAPATFFGGRHGLYVPRLRDTAAAPAFRRSYGCWISLARPMGHGQNAIVTAIGEMLPYADNRVTLHPHLVDRHGLAVPQIACRERANEEAMREHQQRSVLDYAALAGVDVTVGPTRVAPGALVHEVGTARMGADPATSYCNSYAQSWDVPNLFVPDGACWTTSAYQNPTLTMMALAARCAGYVSNQLERQ